MSHSAKDCRAYCPAASTCSTSSCAGWRCFTSTTAPRPRRPPSPSPPRTGPEPEAPRARRRSETQGTHNQGSNRATVVVGVLPPQCASGLHHHSEPRVHQHPGLSRVEVRTSEPQLLLPDGDVLPLRQDQRPLQV